MSLPGIAADPAGGSVESARGLAAFFRSRAESERVRSTSAVRALTALNPVTAQSVDALRPRITLLSDRLTRTADAADTAAGILDDYADALADLALRADLALTRAQDDYAAIWSRRAEALNATSEGLVGWSLGWDDVLPSWLYLDDASYLRRWQGAIDEYRSSRAHYNALHDEREELDRRTADRLSGISLVAELTHDGAVGLGGVAASAALWAGDTDALTAAQIAGLGDPALVRRVWDSLDEGDRRRLTEADPQIIGNLDGLPIAARVAANRISIEREIAARQAEIDRLEGLRDQAHASAYHSESGIDRVYDDLVAEQQTLIDYYRGLLDQKVYWTDRDGTQRLDTGARVVVFDPSRGAIATYHGALDPATGDIPSWVVNVAISVPGTGSNITDFGDARAADLARAAGASTAVFQWAGGEFPQSIPEAMSTSYSHDLGPRLRDFAAGVQVSTPATLTVLGHSYGGAVVGLAEKAGLSADRVLYVAAAGMGDGVQGVADFPNTSDVPHYAMMSRNDLVVGLIQANESDPIALHGQTTLHADGVTRLETGRIVDSDMDSAHIEDYNVPGNGTPSSIDSHSSLYTVGSTAFDNMVAVITGGQAEVYAESQTIVTVSGPVVIDGLDRDDYTPTYITVSGG
ncbi:alpha/beta hydrolase family protein [Microbacterium fluvii]|uniref:Alpha/beta hydrolase family protein n=1 Tax=Microbacterium fluvii TaxID=415215 RepID=A0ABW2HGQ8_9MICO|nr:alpha/beta hydrolase family protein [Microbacterium fluvii]MCU4673961.1 alpha/beta hydrolase family protein [Microbacterium fluvii]